MPQYVLTEHFEIAQAAVDDILQNLDVNPLAAMNDEVTELDHFPVLGPIRQHAQLDAAVNRGGAGRSGRLIAESQEALADINDDAGATNSILKKASFAL